MNNIEKLYWLAGVIDGEGCITIGKDREQFFRTIITITNNNPYLIQEVSKIFSELNMKFFYLLKKRSNPVHKETLVIRAIGMGGCKKLLENIMPYLIGKRQQAEIMLKYINSRKEKLKLKGSHNPYSEEELELIKQIKELNHKNYFLQRLQRKAHQPLSLEVDAKI